MKLEIITIGNELLIGQVVDSNSAWMATRLNEAGFEVNRRIAVGDSATEIKETLTDCLHRADVVLLTGGLGPTRDDLTKQTLCDFFQTTLVFDSAVYQNIEKLLLQRLGHINALNRQQAMVPKACEVIPNPVGTAPVLWFKRAQQIVVAMPGVPHEMEEAMTNEIIPRLLTLFQTTEIIHQTVLVAFLPESVLAEKIAHWENALPAHLSLAYLPSPGKVRLRITARGNNRPKLVDDVNCALKTLMPYIDPYVYGLTDETPQVLLGRALSERKQTIAVAESCTGGTIAQLISSIPGSSAYFKGGIVAYHNQVKTALLNVDAGHLERHGAVSAIVAEEMAIGVRKQLNSDWAIATTGIAGPDGGSLEKPVGTVWIALASEYGVWSEKFQMGTIRARNILRSAETALILLLQVLNGNKSINN